MRDLKRQFSDVNNNYIIFFVDRVRYFAFYTSTTNFCIVKFECCRNTEKNALCSNII